MLQRVPAPYRKVAIVVLAAVLGVAVIGIAFGVVSLVRQHEPSDSGVLPAVVGCFVDFLNMPAKRYGRGAFTIEDIDAKLYTHLCYAFAISEYTKDRYNQSITISSFDPHFDIASRGYQEFVGLKKDNPQAKFLLSLALFPDIPKNMEASFLERAVAWVKENGFDGMDIYHPGMASNYSAKAKFVRFLELMHGPFAANNLTLTVTVSAVSQRELDYSYAVPAIMKYADLVNLMAFNIHDFRDGKVGMNAPVHRAGDTDELNVWSSVKYWLDNGGVASKMVLGISMAGQSYTLSDPRTSDLGAPISGPGRAGYYTRVRGVLSYLEICEMQQRNRFREKWDDFNQVPYAVDGDQWVTYENPKSVAIKAATAVKSFSLAGVIALAIDLDDFKNYCNHGAYPLLRAAHNWLHSARG